MGEVSLQGFHPLEDGMRPFEGWRPLEALGLAILEGEGDGNSPIDIFRRKPFKPSYVFLQGFQPRRFCLVLGPPGCGKSSLGHADGILVTRMVIRSQTGHAV